MGTFPKRGIKNDRRVETRMGKKWLVMDSGVEVCIDDEVERSNIELDRMLEGGGRCKEIDVVRGVISDLVGYVRRDWIIINSGRAVRKLGNGGVANWGPRLGPGVASDPPPGRAEQQAILGNLGVPASRVARIKIYQMVPPVNAHRGEYRKAKKGVKVKRQYPVSRTRKEYRPCICGCGNMVAKPRFVYQGHSAKVYDQCRMVDMGIKKEEDLAPLVRQYYVARKEYRWMRLSEWFRGR